MQYAKGETGIMVSKDIPRSEPLPTGLRVGFTSSDPEKSWPTTLNI